MTAPVDETSILVYDIGGSHISAAVFRADGFRLGPMVTGHHSECQTADAFAELLHSLGISASFEEVTAAGAELAMPGPFDYAAGISHMRHKLPYLYGVDLRQALAGRFGWAPCRVRFINDADAYLLGEVAAGAARGFSRAVGITLGTGVGSAFAIDGHVVTSGPGVPPGGEIWNLAYQGGIVEDLISTRAIQGGYLQRTGQQADVVDIAAAATSAPAAAAVFDDFGHHLGQVLRTVTAEFAPSVIVLGGGISRSSHLFMAAATSELKGLNVELRVSALREHAALVGAGAAWFESAKPATSAECS